MNDPTITSGYCATCGYALQGLTPAPDYRCPECGRPFDPANPKTFHLDQHGPLLHWLAKPLGWPMVLIGLAAAAGVLFVSRWKWGTWSPSSIDLLHYLRPAALRDRSSLMTAIDWIYTLSILVAIAIGFWWIVRSIGFGFAHGRMGSTRPRPHDSPVHLGRRHALMALGLALASAGALLGWPYRLAQQWIANQRIARAPMPGGFPSLVSAPPPPGLSPAQTLATIRSAVIEMPQPTQRMTGLQLLLELYPADALPILTEAVHSESEPRIRALELRLIGLHRNTATLDLLQKFMTSADQSTRAAAAESIGLIHAPAFPIPVQNLGWYQGSQTTIDSAIDLIKLISYLDKDRGRRQSVGTEISTEVKSLDAGQRMRLEKIMLSGSSSEEREAAARGLLEWPPEDYSLRIAEWGVWINDNGDLKLTQSILDEIPRFVHRTANPLTEFKDRINKIMMISKPIIHISVDQPMAIDVQVMIDRGRPWFAYPMPDDFTVRVDTLYPVQSGPNPLQPLENPGLGTITDLRQNYPWLTPAHPIEGYASSQPNGFNDLTAIGLRWQSLIVTPSQLSWMTPPDVGTDPHFDWWNQLRKVPSAWVSSRNETDRFLYYDGPTLNPTPIDAALSGNLLRLTLESHPEEFETRSKSGYTHKITSVTTALPQAILFIQHRAGHLSAQAISPPPTWNADHPECSLTLPSNPLHDQAVIDQFQHMLTRAGLTTPEADGLIAAWRPQFFQTDGARLLIIFAQSDYDVLCPIQIRPKPTELARVGIILTEFSEN